MAVARQGEEATPAVPAPPALRPFLQFARLPPRALVALRRALDTDEEFRSRVAEEVSEAGVGRSGWLYLCRPEGWEEELFALARAAEEEEEQADDRRAENEARRRLAGAENAVRRAEQAVADARAEAARVGAVLADERRARREATEQAAGLDQRLAQTVLARDAARRQAFDVAAEAERLRARVGELEARLRALETVPPPPEPNPPAPSEPPPAVIDTGAAGLGLSAAADAAARLADSLAAAAASLAPPPAAQDRSPPPAAPPPLERRPGVPPRRRRPAPLPPGVLDDSAEAADHLVRVPEAVVLVDGYNVSQTGWPDLPIAEQRRRLVDALSELAARTGADVSVVFDGADTAWPPAVATTARAVKVSFSPAGVEADDVVIGRVAELPTSRPVVVASSDRRVQDGAREAGANVVSSAQLLAALRRWTS